MCIYASKSRNVILFYFTYFFHLFFSISCFVILQLERIQTHLTTRRRWYSRSAEPESCCCMLECCWCVTALAWPARPAVWVKMWKCWIVLLPHNLYCCFSLSRLDTTVIFPLLRVFTFPHSHCASCWYWWIRFSIIFPTAAGTTLNELNQSSFCLCLSIDEYQQPKQPRKVNSHFPPYDNSSSNFFFYYFFMSFLLSAPLHHTKNDSVDVENTFVFTHEVSPSDSDWIESVWVYQSKSSLAAGKKNFALILENCVIFSMSKCSCWLAKRISRLTKESTTQYRRMSEWKTHRGMRVGCIFLTVGGFSLNFIVSEFGLDKFSLSLCILIETIELIIILFSVNLFN